MFVEIVFRGMADTKVKKDGEFAGYNFRTDLCKKNSFGSKVFIFIYFSLVIAVVSIVSRSHELIALKICYLKLI